MIDIKNKENKQVKEIQNSNSFISFLDDKLIAIEELSIFDMAKVLGDSFLFPNISNHRFYQATIDDKEQEDYLVQAYIQNENKPIAFSKDKLAIIEHFKEYMITNHDNLNEYSDVVVHSQEYNLLAYIIYKTIKEIHPKYKQENDPFIVNSILESDLLYKVSVKLPRYIRKKDLSRYDYIFEDNLRSKDNQGVKDEEVRVVIQEVNQNIVFTISKFTAEKPISFSDILNFGMGYSFSDFVSSEYKIPIVLGLLDNEFPRILDYSCSKNIPIIGVRDKCPLAYSFAMNLVLTTHYEDLGFVICSPKENTFWKMFSRNPHVLGYHNDMESFKNVIFDVLEESKKRLKKAKKHKVKKFSELKKHLGENDSQITLILDGVSKILSNYRAILKNASEINYVALMEALNEIAKYSEITGINILAISERGDKTAFPQEIIKNSLVKIAMKDCSENDINTLFGVDVVDLSRPIGLDYNIVEYEEKSPRYCKTCDVGGLSHKQTLSIVRVVAFDWVRKTQYSDLNIIEPPKGLEMLFAYNRNEIAKDSISKLINGQLIPSW